MPTAKLKPADKAPDFDLPGVDGQRIHLAAELPKATVTVVTFICNHCPYVLAYIPRLVALQTEFSGAGGAGGVRFIGICANDDQAFPADSFPNMQKAAADWRLNFPYLHDQDQSVARAYGAERTPEIFVLDAKGVCRYEGGIDDNYQDAAKITKRPLRDALVAMIAGRPVPEPQTHAIGCTIKWKK